MEKDHVVVQVLDNTSINVLPRYESASAAGMDVRTNFGKYTAKELRNRAGENFAVIEEDDGSCNRIVLYPNGRYLFPTGLFVAIPVGYEAQIRPRSGLALKTGVTVLNTPGTIDADYRGEICIILVNTSKTTVTIDDQERLCQMVLAKVEHLRWDIVTELPTTIRGGGGFGHTGNK